MSPFQTHFAGRAVRVSASNPAIVYVHGIGQHLDGYSDRWFRALEPHLTTAVEKREVFWSDLVNSRAILGKEDAATARVRITAEDNFEAKLEVELTARKFNVQGADTDAEAARTKGYSGDDLFAMDDFVRYMVWPPTRESILARFDEVVVPLLKDGRTVHVIAHSWGTVIAYERLRRHDLEQFSGRVANLFVLGSALSLEIVQWNLFDRVDDGRKPAVVAQFFNLNADGDIVGGPFDPPFAATKEFLDLFPTGCPTFPFRCNKARSFVCAHSSYFNPDNTAVNRDILAHHINASTLVGSLSSSD
jgi:metacaspase-1